MRKRSADPASSDPLGDCSLAACARLRPGAVAVALVLCGVVPLSAGAQEPPPVRGSVDRNETTRGPAQSPAAATPQQAERAAAGLAMTATLTEDGKPIEQGLLWRIFQVPAGATAGAKPVPVELRRDPSPRLKLPPGDYIIVASYGRAYATRQISLSPGAVVSERLVLNAGGLKVRAVLPNGAAPPDMSVSFDVYVGEADQSGNRPKVVSGGRPGRVVRLNSGAYQIVSVYGDVNAIVRAEVNIEPGKIAEVTVKHHCAKVTFKLVTRQGGDAQADTRWLIQSPQGETIVESSGALPSHILAAGPYLVVARHGGRTFKREFTVEPGDAMQIEVVMQ